MESLGLLSVEDYDPRRSLMRVRFVHDTGQLGEGRVLSHVFDIKAMADWSLDRSI
jgi:hypothetical protein